MSLNFSSSTSGYEEDCHAIHATLNHLSHLSRVLAHRTPGERQQIRETYREMYGEDLIGHLNRAQLASPKMELSKMMYLWMLEPAERDMVVAREALEGLEPDYNALVEIYTNRKSSQLFLTNQAHLARFKRQLDQDIISLPSNPYQKILVALATSHRSHHVELSHHIAKCDAKRLFEAVKGVAGAVDEPVILEMFSKRSIPQLGLTFASYKHIYGHDFTKALRKESRGEFGESARVVVKCIHDPPKYHSKMLHIYMKGRAESNRSVLSRLMLRGMDSGLQKVSGVFFGKYGMTLQDAICKSIAAGDYRDFLVALIDSSTS